MKQKKKNNTVVTCVQVGKKMRVFVKLLCKFYCESISWKDSEEE